MKGMVEKPPVGQAPSRLKITGRYILQPEVFDLLATQTPGAGGEIQLTDAMQRLMGKQDFHAFKYDGKDYDCGDKLLYLEAFAAMALCASGARREGARGSRSGAEAGVALLHALTGEASARMGGQDLLTGRR